MNAAVKGMPINGSRFLSVGVAPATQPLQPSPNAPVDSSVVMADFARRLRDLEKSIKLQVPNDRILSAIALTTDTALISSDKVAIVGEVTFLDWHRDVSGNPSGTIDPGITKIRGGVIRTGMIENLAATAWVDLDASGSTNFLQCGSAVAVGANGHFTFGDATHGRQFSYDGTNIGLGGSVINLQTGSSLSAIESNATYGATRSVGDITASILSSSGTAITVTSSTLFSMVNGASGSAGVFIGGGGIVGRNSVGATTFAISASTGSATFAGDINTAGTVLATGVTASGSYSAAVLGWHGSGTVGVWGVSSSNAGVVGSSSSASGVNGTSVSGIGVLGQSGSGAGLYGQGNPAVYANGDAFVSGNLSTISFNGYGSPGNILALAGTGTPSNTTAPAGYMQVRTVSSGGAVYIPFYV